MNAFEYVRDVAAQLKARLVARGADPAHPMGLVEAAIGDLDLELAWLEEGDPALKGARGLFDTQSGTICCVNDGGPAERAILVAHEIGHAVVHTSASAQCVARDIDPSRSIEAAPVGLQKVEDYGVRERRELQANVFAREFLLPRTEARRLHLNQHLGASQIAVCMDLPKDLVRQQLLDALLLPSMPAATHQVVRGPERPDPSQDRAANHRGTAFQLHAGPGTGKTRTLVKRVTSLLEEGIDPASILILTFSNRAAGELSERIGTIAPDAAPQMWIGTFHAFGLDLVRRYPDELDLPADPVLFDRSDAIEVLEEILPTLPLVHYRNLWDPAIVLRDMVAAFSRAKDELTDPDGYRRLAQAMLDEAANEEAREAAEKCLEVAQVYAFYEQKLRDHGGVDFGDLVMRPALLLESNRGIRTAVQMRHRHVLVDEYQDVNRASVRLLRGVAGDGRRLWVVGDSRQSVYRFRGASSSNMAAFASEYPNVVSDQLSTNYRSTQEIVNVFVAFSQHMDASESVLPLDLKADRRAMGAPPDIRRFDTLDQEIDGIAAAVRELEKAAVRLRDQAVLCRSNNRLNEIAAGLEARGIPVLHLGSLFERDEVRDLLALLSLAVDRFGDGLARVGAMSRYDLSVQDAYVATRHLRQSDRGALAKLANTAGLPGVSKAGAAGLARLADDLAGLSSRQTPWDFLTTYLFDNTDLLADMATREGLTDRMRSLAVWQFLNFVRERSPAVADAPIQRTLERVRQLVLLAEERDLRQVPGGALHLDAVRLMTVHGSKGLEFDAVHVAGLTKASFPSSNRGQRCPPPDGMISGAEGRTGREESKRAHEIEEECLFFVAASRARSHLRLYVTRFQPSGTKRSPSPFLECLGGHVSEVARPATLSLPPDAQRSMSIQVTWSADHPGITDRRLRDYQRCPRRFFYTHVLGLGGARKQTAFTRTHDCIWRFMRWFASARLERVDAVAAMAEFQAIWESHGPTDHGFAEDYHALARRLVSILVRPDPDRAYREVEALAIDLANGRVVVEPDELANLPDGSVVIRRIRTGRKRSEEDGDLAYTLYHLAGDSYFPGRYQVEALYLTDERAESVDVSIRKRQTRQAKSDQMLAAIARGDFPPSPDAVTCPRCPHFFICAATPPGTLTLS